MSDLLDRLDSTAVASLLRGLFATSPDAIGVSHVGTIRMANPALVRMFGYAEEAELVGRSIMDLVAPAGREAVAELTRRRSVGQAVPPAYVTVGLRADGSELAVEVRSTTYELAEELYSLTFLRDVSARAPDESSARESEDFYRAVFDVNTAVKLLISPSTGRIVDANRAAAEFYGWSLETLRTMRITDINTLTPDEVKAEMESARTLRRSYFKFRHRRAGGDVRSVEVYSGPVEIAGEQLLLSIVHDVTERDELAEQLQQSHRLESIGRLAGGVAHDFNNLLTVMLTCASLLERKLEADSPLRQHARDVRHAAERASELTSSLLAFGRRQFMQPSAVCLNELVDRTVRLLRRTIEPSIAVTTQLAPALPPVHIDPTHIEQVVMNLALNARDAMPRGGTLMLRTELRDGHDDETVSGGRWVTLVVADTGEGMDEATRKRAFEPFFTTKPVGAGTGLGLARVYGTVTQSGGHITLQSAPGAGSAFAVYLPVARTPPVSLEQPEPAVVPPGARRTALLVEDVSGVRGVLADALERAGFCVLQAESAEQALDVLQRHGEARLDVLVSDVVMPGRSGIELARQLLAAAPDLRVLLMSGHARGHDLRDLPDHVRFLSKPFVADELVTAVEQLVPARADR